MACRWARHLAQAPPGDTAGHLVIYNFGGTEQQRMFGNAIARFNERYPNVVVEDLYIPVARRLGALYHQPQAARRQRT